MTDLEPSQTIIRMAASDNSDDQITLGATKGVLLFGVPTTGMDNQEIIGLLQEDNLPAAYTAGLLDERYGFRQHMKQADDFHDACAKSKAIMYAFYEIEKTPTVCRVRLSTCIAVFLLIIIGQGHTALGSEWTSSAFSKSKFSNIWSL